MKVSRRIAIADRSILAHNVYKTILKPLGFSIFHYKTLKELKENHNFKWGCPFFLINTNTFGNHFERHLEWMQKEPGMVAVQKIFLCGALEKNIQSHLKKLPRSQLLLKPFFPETLEEKLKKHG
ncbi:MAG: hypothetical protein Q7T03_01600 [Deltaproteobacteria bacterium]|nr:hypothetical protein [Deltaproteobacteria bacterium]